MPRNPDVSSKLAKARQQLQKAQRRVAELEAELFSQQPNPAEQAPSDEFYPQHTGDLQAALVRVEAILNNSPDAILLADSELYIRQANSSFNTLFGSEWDDYFGKSLLTLLDSDDAHIVSDLLETIAKQPKGKRLEVRAKRKDGTTFDAELSIGVIKGDGLVCIIRDITESKAQEHQLRYHASLQESVSDAVIVIDMANNVQSWNKAAEDIYGWTADEAVGQQSSKFLHYEVSSEEHDRDMRHIQDYGWLKGEIKQFHKNGYPIHVWSSITLNKDENGTPLSFIAVNHDITERKAQERQLRYHASIQESVSDAVIATDMDFRIQSWNHAAEKIYGWSATETIGKSVNEILQTTYESEADRRRILQDFLENGAWQGDVIQRHRNGIPLHIHTAVNLFKDEAGQPVGVVSVNRDITERKQAEAALQKSSAEIHDLYNNAPCGYHSVDKDGLIVQMNDIELRWLGYTRDEVVGRLRITDIFTTESVEVFRKEFPAFMERGWISELEFDVIRKDGSIMHILLNGTAIYDDDGQYLKSRSTLFDITALQQAQQAIIESETRYRLLAENISDVIAKVNSDGIRTYITPSCFALLGYTPDELVGKPSIELVHPDDGPTSRAMVVDAINGSNSETLVTQRVQHKAGHYLWVEVKVSILRDSTTGSLLEVIMVMRDITERKQAEAQLQKSEERLRTIVDNIPVMISFYDTKARFEYVNQSWLDQLGWTLDDLNTTNNPISLVQPDPNYQRQMLEFLGSGERGWRDFNNQTKHRGKRIISWTTVHLSDEHRMAAGQDITDRKRADEALQVKMEEEHQLQLKLIALHEIVIELTGIDELGALHKRAVELGRDRLGFERLALFLYDEKDGNAIGTFGTNPQGQVVDEQGSRFLPDPNGLMRRSLERTERFCFDDPTTLYNDEIPVGEGWNAAAVLWNGTSSLGWFVADNLLSRAPATKSLLDTLGLYALSVGSLIAQKQTQLALRESEAKFRLLLNAAPIATVISDQAGRIALVNMQAESLFGYSRSELSGQMIEILVPDYAREAHVNNRNSYLLAPRVRPMAYGIELYARRKDGSAVPVEIELSYIETRDGIMVMSFIMDITERKRIAAELEQQRSFLRNVIDTSPSMIFVKDYDARFVLANPPVAAVYNTTMENLIGKTDAELNPSTQEVISYLEADRHVITSGERIYVEEPLTNFAGKTHWLQTTKVPIFSADGNSKYVLGISTDITERREAEEALRTSEEKYRLLVETMRGGLAVFDTDYRVNFVNDRFCQLLGFSREEAIGKQPWDFIDATDIPLVQSHMDRRQNAESTSYEILLRHRDGHPIHVLLSGSPLLDKDEKYYGSLVVATDITLQKQAEVALRQSLAKEKELGDLKTRFVSMASHEFRTPLATILALVETLASYRSRLTDEQIEQRLDKIKDQVSHLKDIMEDVLMLARMQARRVEFNPVKLDLDSLLRSVLDEFEERADVKHQLVYTVSEGNHEVALDRKLMRQIISNLVSNAIKYSPETKVVGIKLHYSDTEVILTISDEGIGIPQADLPHLFEPFHRGVNVGTISGTGLGLVITREAVELHGGTITVESEPGIGTVFTIRIPIVMTTP
jgi:PAS domain S-box-containing protein